ncbi:hypothetical protein ONZ45_g12906 [Pleurotus djamor]|nr:hypothetical protein ONZ45_g12906 [Pleurotus djamor]
MINILPFELLLATFREFHLTSIIAASGVCQEWRRLLLIANIHPSRRALLDIYLHIIGEPWFLDSRPWVLQNLSEFNRRVYVNTLLQQHDYLPDEFMIWVLEWPAKAVFGGIWPGLPTHIHDLVGPIGPAGWLEGWNLLNFSKPVVWTVNAVNDKVDLDFDLDPDANMGFTHFINPLPGIPVVIENDIETVWVLLDKGHHRDQVIQTYKSDHEFCSFTLNMEDTIFESWTACLHRKLGHLRHLHHEAHIGQLPIIPGPYPPPSDPIKLSSSCKPWSSSSHLPYLRSVYYVSDDEEETS